MKIKIRFSDKEYEVEMDGDSISYQRRTTTRGIISITFFKPSNTRSPTT